MRRRAALLRADDLRGELHHAPEPGRRDDRRAQDLLDVWAKAARQPRAWADRPIGIASERGFARPMGIPVKIAPRAACGLSSLVHHVLDSESALDPGRRIKLRGYGEIGAPWELTMTTSSHWVPARS